MSAERITALALRDIERHAAALNDGSIDASTFEQRMQRTIATMLQAAAFEAVGQRNFAGRIRQWLSGVIGATALPRADKAALADELKAQLGFLRAFVTAIRSGALSPAQISARAALYATSASAFSDYLRWGEWVLPFLPRDGGTRCQMNCRCSCEVEDQGDGKGLYYYRLGTAEHCDDCVARAQASPYTVRRSGIAAKAISDAEVKHGKHDQRSHGRKGRAGKAGAAAYTAARAGGASLADARAAGKAATAEERAKMKTERIAARGSVGALKATPAPLNAIAEPVLRFDSPADGDAYLRGAMKVKLTKAEVKSLSGYQGNGYLRINSSLRRDDYQGDYVGNEINNIDAAMRRSSTPNNIEVYRGMSLRPDRWETLNGQLQVGQTFQDPAFISTALSPNVSRSFTVGTKTETPVSMRIRVPQGTPSVYINANIPNMAMAGEYELLLARNTPMRVVGRTTRPDGVIEVDMEVIQ